VLGPVRRRAAMADHERFVSFGPVL